MKKKISVLKLNTILFLYTWLVYCIYGLLKSFEVDGAIFSIIMILSLLSFPLLFKSYKPYTVESYVGNYFVKCGSVILSDSEIIKVVEVNPVEKIFFTIKSPKFDFSTSFFQNGIILKACHDSYLIDNIKATFLDEKKSRKLKSSIYGIIVFYLLLLFPLFALGLNHVFKADHILFVLPMVIFILLFCLRLMPAFYLCRKVNLKELPISQDEYANFKDITIIEGFIMSDRIMTVPFKKIPYLDGLAVDILFKRFIVLNPRLFVLNSKDYLRFVLFHEFCHIRHHDSTASFILPPAATLLYLILYFLPGGYYLLPYADYIVFGVVIIYLIYSITCRKRIEKRADLYGIKKIGREGVERVYAYLGYDLIKKND